MAALFVYIAHVQYVATCEQYGVMVVRGTYKTKVVYFLLENAVLLDVES